jgi:cellulose synthase/poly-beta-1,6-N-acetylglucosamine synthase-like glycosyltransferase
MAAEDCCDQPLISVCIPVKNGEGRLEHCLQSLRDLDYPQEKIEIIIADGLSTDRTVDIAKAYGALVLTNPKQIVASGRNIAFGAATGAYIASTDDDCVVPPNWLTVALTAFEDPEVGAIGGPSYLPDDSTPLAKAANVVFRQASRAGYSVQADHMVAGSAEDLPGCNAVYRTDVLREVGAFDESLVTAEDVDFHWRIRDLGKKLVLAPEFFVWHHKRATLRGLFRQLSRFAAGRVQLARKRPGARRFLHGLLGWVWVYGVAIIVALALLLPLWALGAILAGGWIIGTGRALLNGEPLNVALLVPLAFLVVAFGWSTGYVKETLFPMSSTAGR